MKNAMAIDPTRPPSRAANNATIAGITSDPARIVSSLSFRRRTGVTTTPRNPPTALAASTTPKNHAGCPAPFRRNASWNVRKPTHPRMTIIAVPEKTMLGAASSIRSSSVSSGAGRPAAGILRQSRPAEHEDAGGDDERHAGSNSQTAAAAGSPPTTLATTLTSERREFASTSACSSFTTAGTSADFATVWPLDRIKRDERQREQEERVEVADHQEADGAAPEAPDGHERPPAGLAPVERRADDRPHHREGRDGEQRYSRTWVRDCPSGWVKKIEPASDTVRQASPTMLAAWAATSRPNGFSE